MPKLPHDDPFAAVYFCQLPALPSLAGALCQAALAQHIEKSYSQNAE